MDYYYFIKVIFVVQDVSMVDFKSGVLGGVCHFWEGSLLKQYYHTV